jgi:hypothetical protein
MAFALNSDDWSNRTWIVIGILILVFILGLILLAPKALKLAGYS